MKFILWTAVYWLLVELGEILRFGYPYHQARENRYGKDIVGIAALFEAVIWIAVYIIFIK